MNSFVGIVQKITLLNKKLIKNEEIIDIVEITNNLIEELSETNNKIKTINIQSRQNVFLHLMRFRVDLIDQKTDFMDLKDLIKKILKRVYNILQNSKAEPIFISDIKIAKDDFIVKLLEDIIILVKMACKEHCMLIPEETKIKKAEEKIRYLYDISKKIKLMTDKVDIENIPQVTNYLEFLLAKLPNYKKTINLLINIVDETALQFYSDDFE